MAVCYTGVGCLETPPDILDLMTRIAQKMQRCGIILRSGGAIGADMAFERGAGSLKQIFYSRDATPESIEIAARFHPAWHRVRAKSPYVAGLHGRNVFQVLGRDLQSPSRGLICWTRDGCVSHSTRCFDTGGTGTAISIADVYGVPISNLAIPEHRAKWESWVAN